jgi:hypothetical protein
MEKVITQGNQTLIKRDNGVNTSVVLNNDGSLTTGTHQDCTPIVDHVASLRNEGHHGSKDMRLAASVPFVVVEKYCNEKGITFQEFGNSQEHKICFLNDPDYKLLRVWGGHV